MTNEGQQALKQLQDTIAVIVRLSKQDLTGDPRKQGHFQQDGGETRQSWSREDFIKAASTMWGQEWSK